MNQEEYNQAIDKEHHKLSYLLKRNTNIALLGLGLAGGLLLYDIARLWNITNKLIKEPLVNEIYLSKEVNETTKQAKQEELKTIIEDKYLPKVERSKDIQNISVGIAGASGLYFVFGSGILALNSRRKRKSLERQLAETSSE